MVLENWRPNRNGKGESLRASELVGELKRILSQPDSILDMGPWHYRSWTGKNGIVMVSRYLRKEPP